MNQESWRELHPDVASTRIALGIALHYSGRFNEVERLFERLYGPDHPETANVWGTAALLEERRGNLHTAGELGQPPPGDDRLELARALLALEQEDEARNVLDRALPVLVSTFGEADERVRDGRALRARAGSRSSPPPASVGDTIQPE